MLPRNSFSFSLCLLLVVVLFHLCLSNQNPDDVLCMDIEKHALLEFKHGLIDETDRLASWVDDGESNCCKWAGIVCDNVTRHVHQIHLRALDGYSDYDYDYESERRSRLRGNVSPSLLHLKQLRHLDLSCNNFEGIQIPSFIGSLGNLRYLNLSRSNFGGIIPHQLGNLSELNVLSLAGNFGFSLMNMQWLSSLRVLHHLDMNRVNLSEARDWFQVINTIPSLVQLHLSDCKLPDIHPHVHTLNLTSLTLLDLSFNDFSSYVPRWIFSITSLVSLDLSWCYFHSHVPNTIDSFRNLTSLELLHVSRNDFMNSPLVLEGLSSTIASNLVSLDISSCGVSSSVLESLHNLTSLLSLDLSDNQLTKSIPKSLGNLCNLRDIDLSYNDFSNITLTYLLESFSYCKSSRLESLSLYSTNISGHLSDQLGQLTHLKYLQLSRNLIPGPIPFSIGRLSSLEELDVSYNRLNGSIPDSIGQLSNLKTLDFSYNLLTGVVKEAHFEKLVKLKYLSGDHNNLTLRLRLRNWIPPFDQIERLLLNSWVLGPQFPLWLQLLKNLIALDISNTCILEYMPKSLWRSFTNLNYLNMSRNRIQGTLWSIPETLQVLDLSSNEFSGNLTQLSNGSLPILLDLSNNFFVGSLNHLLCSNGVKATQALNLGNNHFSGVIPECWENWWKLRSLNLENNNLSGEIPRTLGSLSNLESLSMSRNKILGRLPSSLMNLTNLEMLQLGRNGLVGIIPSWLGRELSSLRLLNLRSNNFDGIIPQELCYLKTIQILDLADNKLSGNIPKCFNNFSVLSGKVNITNDGFYLYMVYGTIVASDFLVMKGREDTYSTILKLVMLLDLSSNNLVGHIPSEVTDLVSLKSLNLSRNQLTGRIPEKIGDLKSLETFDVSTNKLSGELPTSLSSLSFLSSFNVSYNNFTGRIPSSTQLQSLNESSFLGNTLCGAPLESCAVKVPDTEAKKEDDESNGVDWGLIISITLGIITGLWIVVAPLIVSRSWRIAYFNFFSELRYKVCDVIRNYWCNMCRK